jgi:hypothetical protein
MNRAAPRARALPLLVALTTLGCPASAQDATGGWGADVGRPSAGTTSIPRSVPGAETNVSAQVRLVAVLTADGQMIDNGLVWHVFQSAPGTDSKTRLVGTHRTASPTLSLEPGDYVVNAAFGRANLTRKISVKPSATPAVEQFVINAGGLRVGALVGGQPATPGTVSYDIQSDRDQSDDRKVIMADAKPGLIIRLNAGIYHVVSKYGDANAIVESDVTVEAGKLTEAQISHSAAKTTLKLVTRKGGEALSDTQWTILTKDGRLVKESVGALPTHLLAPGAYLASARNQGKVYAREFEVKDGETTVVEVIVAQSIEP